MRAANVHMPMCKTYLSYSSDLLLTATVWPYQTSGVSFVCLFVVFRPNRENFSLIWGRPYLS